MDSRPDAGLDQSPEKLYQQLLGARPAVPGPIVPVIVWPSKPKGQQRPPATARQLGFLHVDPTGATNSPGDFYPLLPVSGGRVPVSAGKLDKYGNTSHWPNGGCFRLLTSSEDASLAFMDKHKFVDLWEKSGDLGCASNTAGAAGFAAEPQSSQNQDGTGAGSGGGGSSSDSSATAFWHVSCRNLLLLQEAYGGLCSKLKAQGYDLDNCHYMLKGRETTSGAARKKTSKSKGIKLPDAAQHDLRAVANWPGLLDMIEQEQPHVTEVSTSQVVGHWLARMPIEFQQQLKDTGIINPRSTVHHIIAKASRGIDHPLNYYIIDGSANSSMGAKVDGIRGSDKKSSYHMRQVVGEKWFAVAEAACNLYHGMLHPLAGLTMRHVRQAAFEQAQQVMSQRTAAGAASAAAAAATDTGGAASAAAAAATDTGGAATPTATEATDTLDSATGAIVSSDTAANATVTDTATNAAAIAAIDVAAPADAAAAGFMAAAPATAPTPGPAAAAAAATAGFMAAAPATAPTPGPATAAAAAPPIAADPVTNKRPREEPSDEATPAFVIRRAVHTA